MTDRKPVPNSSGWQRLVMRKRLCGFLLHTVAALFALAFSIGLAHANQPKPKSASPFPPDAIEFFEARVRPVLVEHCAKCHGDKKQSGGLRLDSREAILTGGDNGPSVVPAKPRESLLIQAVAHTHGELQMPPKSKLPATDIATLSHWVELGAPWSTNIPKTAATPSPATHWAFQPVKPAPIPKIKANSAIQSPVDAFILSRLEAQQITLSPRADRRTLIRRASLDLLGIPPTAQEVAAFEADASPNAFERLVDRLLASPHYGERWARHWLDVARYADTKGYVFTFERRYPFAYTYRDYVIRAFNTDLGYDQFILHQLAADQVVTPADPRPLAALGYLTVGRRFLLDQNEIIDDRIDVVTRGLLGLTVTCARCHDHKYDPIPTEDYYSLYGVMASSVEPGTLPLLDPPGTPPSAGRAIFDRKVAEAEKARSVFLDQRRSEAHQDITANLSRYLKATIELSFNPDHPKQQERALADKLNARRLRTITILWARAVTAASPDDPILGPWRTFAAVPVAEFPKKAAEVQRNLADPKRPARIDPLVTQLVLGTVPSSMHEVALRYVNLFTHLESQPKSTGEALRSALFAPGKPLYITDPELLAMLDQTENGQLGNLNGAIETLGGTEPGAPDRGMVMNDAPQPAEPHIFIRGNPGRPGKQVTRHFVHVIAGPNPPPFQKGSGRLELARAIADPANPLTARVLVNRVWTWHFGKALVNTPSDFGVRSDPPTHPELLDYLASDFVASGWSIKSLHRRIMLSSTYQQASEPRPDALAKDPENRLVWRFNRQRLDFESMRDSILAVSGDLDPALGGRPVSIIDPPVSRRRTLYGFIDRQNLDGLYRTFDFAVPDATSPRRFVTTVPQQALFLMNSPFLHDESRQLVNSTFRDPTPSSGGSSVPDDLRLQEVRHLYRRALSRDPSADELALAVSFLDRAAAASGSPGAWKRASDKRPEASASDRTLSPWEQLAQVLLLTNEFLFVD
jgi:hypothetical protein